MKIGFDAKRLYNNFTGLGNHSRTTIDILTEEFPNNEYVLFTPKVSINNITLQYLSKKHCKTIQPHGLIKGSLWRTFSLVKELKKNNIELFHGLSNELPWGIKYSGIKSLLTIHDVAFKTFPDMYSRIDQMIYDKKWKHACHEADRIIAISECTKDDIIRYYNVEDNKIDVVYQPVSPIYYNENKKKDLKILTSLLGENANNPYMLYVGSVNSRKNLLGIVQAMERLPKDLQLPLVIVGRGGAYMQKVQSYISQHNMEHLFIWLEIFGHEQLMQLYLNATVFIYPSFCEGFGLPVVEAELCGCPVVTSNISSLPEAGGPFALKANPYDSEEISSKIEQLLNDSEFRAETASQAYQHAMKTFHPSVLAKQLMKVYENI